MAVKNQLYLHRKQMEVYQSKHRFRVVVAGRRWGKTQLAKVSILRASKAAKQLIWYVAPSYRMAKQIMWPELMESIPKRWITKINETNLTITLINGTRIELKGADNPDSLRGVGINFIVLDEVQDIDPEAWNKVLRPTLASTRGSALFIGTPKSYNFLYSLYMLGQRGPIVRNSKGIDVPNTWKSWQFPTITSPFIPLEEIDAAREDMDDKSFSQEFEASFETMSGRVFYPFDRKIHVKSCPFNPDLDIWIGQDFNLDPMSSIILQPQPNGEVWGISELMMKSGNSLRVAEELERRYFKYQKQCVFYPDPAGNYRQHARGESDLDIFRDSGFTRQKFRKKHPPVADRNNSVNRMLRTASGKVRLYFDPSCKNAIESLEQTIYKPGTREVDKTGGAEHFGDAIGYPMEFEFPLRKIEILGISI